MSEERKTDDTLSAANPTPYTPGDMLAMMDADPLAPFRIEVSRLYTVRYVFLVHIEDGIPGPIQRAALEYIDTVVRDWPRCDGTDELEEGQEIVTPLPARYRHAAELFDKSEKCIAKFVHAEQEDDVDEMVNFLVALGDAAAALRDVYQPGYNLPTFAEIRRLVQDEWDEGIGALIDEAAKESKAGEKAGNVDDGTDGITSAAAENGQNQ